VRTEDIGTVGRLLASGWGDPDSRWYLRKLSEDDPPLNSIGMIDREYLMGAGAVFSRLLGRRVVVVQCGGAMVLREGAP
jgi:hypothetical protein